MQHEAECCATISIIYTSHSSAFHMTEPKYTSQDIFTIICGNIEAWLGLSAISGYLFLERIYDALAQAQLFTSKPTRHQSAHRQAHPSPSWRSLLGRLHAAFAAGRVQSVTRRRGKGGPPDKGGVDNDNKGAGHRWSLSLGPKSGHRWPSSLKRRKHRTRPSLGS